MSAQAQLQPMTQVQAQPQTMKAIVQVRYGSPEQLELKEVERPTIDPDSVLVRVRAASVNALDWHMLHLPALFRLLFGTGLRVPKRTIPGVDSAGRVEAVGSNVTEFKPGDEVIGHRSGSFAEYVRGKETNFVLKPLRLTFEQAAALPVAGLTALQGLRDKGRVKPGQRVLVNGAGGGVGTFAVQIAKALGAEVTAVTSRDKVELVRSIGADRVIDRAERDFTRSGERYDVIFDIGADRSFSDYGRALADDGIVVLCGAPPGLTPVLTRMLAARVLSRFAGRKLVFFIAEHSKEDLLALKELIESGKLTPVIDHTFELSEISAAFRRVGERRARGKVVVRV